jgi:hypothetical protein
LGLAAIVLGAVASVVAQEQVATVSSAAAFHLRGASVVPGQGVPDWPVLIGDTVKADNASTLLTFGDGSVIVLAPNSAAKVGMSGNVPTFQLVSGSATYSLKSLDAVRLIVGNHIVKLAGLKGSYGANALGFWTPIHIAVIAGVGGVGGATAAALGVAEANNGGAQVSPSH